MNQDVVKSCFFFLHVSFPRTLEQATEFLLLSGRPSDHFARLKLYTTAALVLHSHCTRFLKYYLQRDDLTAPKFAVSRLCTRNLILNLSMCLQDQENTRLGTCCKHLVFDLFSHTHQVVCSEGASTSILNVNILWKYTQKLDTAVQKCPNSVIEHPTGKHEANNHFIRFIYFLHL